MIRAGPNLAVCLQQQQTPWQYTCSGSSQHPGSTLAAAAANTLAMATRLRVPPCITERVWLTVLHACMHAGAAARGEYQAHTLQILVADVPGVLQQVRAVTPPACHLLSRHAWA
jgi:hypothetical protein